MDCKPVSDGADGSAGTAAAEKGGAGAREPRAGAGYLGRHLIIDFAEAANLTDQGFIGRALRKAVAAAGATLLDVHLHRFTLGGGISGVAVLAESHISIHTWPESGYVALDIFMCGDCDPDRALEVLREAFRPKRVAVIAHRRGEARVR